MNSLSLIVSAYALWRLRDRGGKAFLRFKISLSYGMMAVACLLLLLMTCSSRWHGLSTSMIWGLLAGFSAGLFSVFILDWGLAKEATIHAIPKIPSSETKRIAGTDILESYPCTDVAATDKIS